jgi:hypothetical protein
VLAARPLRVQEGGWATELFGDYHHDNKLIRVWMRTAVQKHVTSFGTFFSTLCHEFCHHLDREWLGFPHTPHTRGFLRADRSALPPRAGHTAEAAVLAGSVGRHLDNRLAADESRYLDAIVATAHRSRERTKRVVEIKSKRPAAQNQHACRSTPQDRGWRMRRIA